MTTDPMTIVLVDDASDVRLVVSMQLSMTGGFTVVGEGATGREAVELARRHQPDVVLLDVSMPDVDGIEALPEIIEASPSTRVVIFTGFASADLDARARSRGAAGLIAKSIPLEELPQRLRDVVSGASAQDVLSEHVERFREVFDRATIGMATVTLTGTVARANAALAVLVRTDAFAMVGQPYIDFVADDDVAPLRTAMLEVSGAKVDTVGVAHRVTTAPGRWVRVTVSAVRDSNGEPLYLFLQVEDITAARHAEAELRASEERFRMLVDAVVDYAIFVLDRDGHVASWNPGAERIKGYRASEIVGKHFRAFYPPEAQADGHPEEELAIASREGRYEEEGWRVRKDGSRFWANVVITALRDDAGELVGFSKITRDTTERMETTRLLREAAEEKANFLAVTAHELRSPVVAISAGTQMLLEHWKDLDEEGRAQTVGAIHSSTGRIRRLVDDLLIASRLESRSIDFDLAPVALHAALSDIVATFGAAEAVTVNGPLDVRVLADHGRLVQVVTNLLNNAIAYGAPPITIDIAAEGESVVFKVCDAGAGVADELVPRLFDKFTRQSRKTDSGTGLGLYIVREMARGQGGDAWYERSPTGGPVFAVRLPAA